MFQDLNKPENRLLAALPVEEYKRLLPHLQLVQMPLKQVLYEMNEPIQYVYFPQRSLVSLVSLLEDGTTVEVGIVGRKGMVGAAVFMGSETATHQEIVQVADSAIRMSATQLKAEFNRGDVLQALLLRYMQSLFTQVAQVAVCNRRHNIEQRLARWLLMVSDQMGTDNFPMTQEFMSQMLGTRRSGVSVAAEAIQQDGIIRYRRGQINIIDRDGLEGTACKCYGIIRTEFNRLLCL